MKHTPVFFEQTIEALNIHEGGRYIDGTAGEGGHFKKILEHGGKVLALDYDKNQIIRLAESVQHPNLILVAANFKDIAVVAKEHGFLPADGILLDLGLSMGQLSGRGNGLSYRFPEEPLDMRLGDADRTAAQILNDYEEEDLVEMLVKNAEEVHADALAKAIVNYRQQKKFGTVAHLLEAINDVVKDDHPRARVFQALRIEVNDELANLKKVLDSAVDILADGGRLVIITFHSLEDRIVKQFGRKETRLKEEKFKIRKFDRARFERSAQLRVFTKHSV